MGREIRRVPPNWQHPRDEKGRYQPMIDRTYKEAINEWIEEYQKWESGEQPDYLDDDERALEYWEIDSPPPLPKYYRPNWKEEPTWYQVYETVSEGTPVSPPFETTEELINYLVENGDFWDQERRKERTFRINCAPWTREQAESFVLKTGWAPSMIAVNGRIMRGTDYTE